MIARTIALIVLTFVIACSEAPQQLCDDAGQTPVERMFVRGATTTSASGLDAACAALDADPVLDVLDVGAAMETCRADGFGGLCWIYAGSDWPEPGPYMMQTDTFYPVLGDEIEAYPICVRTL